MPSSNILFELSTIHMPTRHHDAENEATELSIIAAFNLDGDTYRDKYAMLCIHMWMTLVRLRSEGKPGKDLTQKIYDNFQEDVEHRVRAAGVKVLHHRPQLRLVWSFTILPSVPTSLVLDRYSTVCIESHFYGNE